MSPTMSPKRDTAPPMYATRARRRRDLVRVADRAARSRGSGRASSRPTGQAELGLEAAEDRVGRVHVGRAGDLRQEDPREVRAHHRLEVAQDHPRRDRLHAHEVHRVAGPGRGRVEELAHEAPRPDAHRLRARRARLLDVEEQRVGARLRVLGDARFLIAGREEQRSQRLGVRLAHGVLPSARESRGLLRAGKERCRVRRERTTSSFCTGVRSVVARQEPVRAGPATHPAAGALLRTLAERQRIIFIFVFRDGDNAMRADAVAGCACKRFDLGMAFHEPPVLPRPAT